MKNIKMDICTLDACRVAPCTISKKNLIKGSEVIVSDRLTELLEGLLAKKQVIWLNDEEIKQRMIEVASILKLKEEFPFLSQAKRIEISEYLKKEENLQNIHQLAEAFIPKNAANSPKWKIEDIFPGMAQKVQEDSNQRRIKKLLNSKIDLGELDYLWQIPSEKGKKEIFQSTDIVITDRLSELLEGLLAKKAVIWLDDEEINSRKVEHCAIEQLKKEYPKLFTANMANLSVVIKQVQEEEELEIVQDFLEGTFIQNENLADVFIEQRLGVADTWLKSKVRQQKGLFAVLKTGKFQVRQGLKLFKQLRKASFLKEKIKALDVILTGGYYKLTAWFYERGFRFSANTKRLYSFKNKYKGQKCFLIGNGPSLNIHDLEMLKDEVTFGCNRVYKLFEDTKWRPTYYCMIDALIAKYSSDELAEKVKCPVFTNLTTKDLMKNIPDDLVFARNLGIQPYEVNDNFLAYYVPSGATVMTFMLELAMYMGFKEIHLLGVDCTSSLASNGHCAKGYVNEELIKKDIERICKRLNNPNLTAEQVASYYKEQSTFSYQLLKEYASMRGVTIYNSTRGGMLEVYERKTLEEAVNG